ncbi:MAG: Bax inhibitor-1 family protein [Promethearchaeota archaeon]
MGFNYYRKIADTESYLDEENIDMIIKYNVIPTLASGTIVFALTMFAVNSSPAFTEFIFSLGGLITSIVLYTLLSFITYFVTARGSNNLGLFLFYALCFASGLIQAPVIQFAIWLVGFEDTITLFSIAIVSATLGLVAIWMLTRSTDKFFRPGQGFSRFWTWISIFGVIGFMVWMVFSIFLSFNWFLLLSSIASIFIVGIFTLFDIRAIRQRVASGNWMYATVHLSMDYFILIVRIFLILVIGRASTRD